MARAKLTLALFVITYLSGCFFQQQSNPQAEPIHVCPRAEMEKPPAPVATVTIKDSFNTDSAVNQEFLLALADSGANITIEGSFNSPEVFVEEPEVTQVNEAPEPEVRLVYVEVYEREVVYVPFLFCDVPPAPSVSSLPEEIKASHHHDHPILAQPCGLACSDCCHQPEPTNECDEDCCGHSKQPARRWVARKKPPVVTQLPPVSSKPLGDCPEKTTLVDKGEGPLKILP